MRLALPPLGPRWVASVILIAVCRCVSLSAPLRLPDGVTRRQGPRLIRPVSQLLPLCLGLSHSPNTHSLTGKWKRGGKCLMFTGPLYSCVCPPLPSEVEGVMPRERWWARRRCRGKALLPLVAGWLCRGAAALPSPGPGGRVSRGAGVLLTFAGLTGPCLLTLCPRPQCSPAWHLGLTR